MKSCLLMFMLMAIFVVGIGCKETEYLQKPQMNSENKPNVVEVTKVDETPMLLSDETLLLLDDEPLLLLDDEPVTEQSGQPGADNSSCFVCHMNYMEEDIAVVHANVGIGCPGCHGDEHIADESWASGGNGTAPDKINPRSAINPFCMGCHPKDRIDTPQHKPLFAADGPETYCTDCHGEHRLVNRKRKWK